MWQKQAGVNLTALLNSCSLFLTLGCTPSNVSSPPAEPQKPQCRRNVEQSLVFQVVSGIWLKGKHTFNGN